MLKNEIIIDSHRDYVPTSHYHLALRHVILIVFVCVVLGGIIIMLSLFAVVSPNTAVEQLVVPPTPVAVEAVSARAPFTYADNAVSFIYPLEYELMQQEAIQGSLATYGFIRKKNEMEDEKNPRLDRLVMYTAASIQTAGEASNLPPQIFEGEKKALETVEVSDKNEIITFEDQRYLVANNVVATGSVRRYVTYVNETRIEITIWMPSVSESMQADELFHQFRVISNAKTVPSSVVESANLEGQQPSVQ